jgi:UDP-glucose 4-epimerase
VSLRYFNVAGDFGLGYVDPQAENVIPLIMEAVMGRREFEITGTDYATEDGTGIRDYIHIEDLVRGHILALKVDTNEIINLGSSTGVSVRELIRHTIEVTGKNFKYKEGPRRAGDCSLVVASNAKAKELLGWEPERNIGDMIGSTFRAYQKGELSSK